MNSRKTLRVIFIISDVRVRFASMGMKWKGRGVYRVTEGQGLLSEKSIWKECLLSRDPSETLLIPSQFYTMAPNSGVIFTK